MTDERETPLTPDQDAAVRRLLSEARSEEPMPPEVVSRMDRVLEDLADEPGRRAPVVHLAARRRRATSLLVAAAAVVVVGIGIGQVVDDSGSDGDDAGAGAGADSFDAPNSAAEGQVQEPAAPDERTLDGAATGPDLLVAPQDLYTVQPDELARDVERLREQGANEARSGFAARVRGYRLGDTDCRAADWGTGLLIPIQYGANPGGLVLRAPLGDTQVADVYLCGDRSPVRSLTLPVP